LFEAEHSERADATAERIWELWIDPGRWSEWDQRVERAEADAELEPGSEVRVKLRKGGTMKHEVVALDPGHRLVTEYRLPGARAGHERTVYPGSGGVEVTHRLYVEGPLSAFWALMLGRKRMSETVAGFTDAKPKAD